MSLMAAEIAEQPAVLEKTLREEAPRFDSLRRKLAERKPAIVVLVARGTSDNAAGFGRYLIEITTGIPVSLAAPSVTTLYGGGLDWSKALVVGISQSGESTDTNACLEAARASGALTVGITNEPDSALAGIVDEVFLLHAGRERSVAATKTYTGQVLMMYLLARALGAPIELDSLKRVPEAAQSALALSSEVERLAERCRFMERAVVMGRGLNYANAFEFALKMMETCYVTAERFSGADFAHGPIALIERDFPVFLFAAEGPTLEGSREMLERLAGLEAETLVIGPASRRDILGLAQRSIALPDPPPPDDGLPADLYTPIPWIVPAQMFAAALALEKGLDPDRPRTLSKVTKTL